MVFLDNIITFNVSSILEQRFLECVILLFPCTNCCILLLYGRLAFRRRQLPLVLGRQFQKTRSYQIIDLRIFHSLCYGWFHIILARYDNLVEVFYGLEKWWVIIGIAVSYEWLSLCCIKVTWHYFCCLWKFKQVIQIVKLGSLSEYGFFFQLDLFRNSIFFIETEGGNPHRFLLLETNSLLTESKLQLQLKELLCYCPQKLDWPHYLCYTKPRQ